MRLAYTVIVDVDPSEIEGGISVVADEIRSNLESVGYVRDCVVEYLTEPSTAPTRTTVSIIKGAPTMNEYAEGGASRIARTVIDLDLKSDRRLRALEYMPGDRRAVRAVFFPLE